MALPFQIAPYKLRPETAPFGAARGTVADRFETPLGQSAHSRAGALVLLLPLLPLLLQHSPPVLRRAVVVLAAASAADAVVARGRGRRIIVEYFSRSAHSPPS